MLDYQVNGRAVDQRQANKRHRDVITYAPLFPSSLLSSSWTLGWLVCLVSTPRPDLWSSRPCGSMSRPTSSKTLTSASSSTVTNTCSRWADLTQLQICFELSVHRVKYTKVSPLLFRPEDQHTVAAAIHSHIVVLVNSCSWWWTVRLHSSLGPYMDTRAVSGSDRFPGTFSSAAPE